VLAKDYRLTKFKLTEKGMALVKGYMDEHTAPNIPAEYIMDAMTLLVGYDDLKQTIARAIELRQRTNFLLEGPPACGKSLLMEGVRSSVPDSYIAFGSRTSGAGLSDMLFEKQPGVLLLDEMEKIPKEAYPVLLGLMETGEILETKSRSNRGIKLNTLVIAACNSSAKFPAEILSRFAMHVHFPAYDREKFIDICVGFLSRAEGCPADIAEMIGREVYNEQLGDVRKAKAVWKLMSEPSEAEIQRVISMMLKYGTGQVKKPVTASLL
jgi:Holliday junction DNA helicase RuvB